PPHILLFCCPADHPALHSFPTRRSSDLELLKNENEKLIELLGDVYGHQRKWTEAKNEYKKLVEKDPENAEYQYKYGGVLGMMALDRKSTRLNSSHVKISYAVFCLKKKTK